MTFLDWFIVGSYMLGLVGLGIYLNASQETPRDYFLAGQSMSWWQTGSSTMATQLSAVSFVSAPAFVALKEDGGLRWLAYEFAVPLSLIVVMAVIIPVLHRGGYISMHEYLSDRFDDETRTLVSGVFLVMRGLSSGVIVYAGAKVLAVTLPFGIPESVLIIGVVTIVYDVLGGIGVVIISDVIQMALIVAGLIFCGFTAVEMIGLETALGSMKPERTRILFFDEFGVSADSQYGFWPFLIGGFFLYVSYYGCDQSQVQREMAVENEDEVRKSLLFNAFGRFPIVLIYCMVGIMVGAVFLTSPELVASGLEISEKSLLEKINEQPDFMLPYFIVAVLPVGITGLLVAAVMAALMSSLDSAMNSLSAITMRDFYQEFWEDTNTASHYLQAGRWFTLCWGTFATASAFLFHYFSPFKTVIEQINSVGNMFYGPLGAVFLIGMLTDWSHTRGIKTGVILGLGGTMLVWQNFPFVSWLWWGPIGFSLTALVAGIHETVLFDDRKTAIQSDVGDLEPHETDIQKDWRCWYYICGAYFFVIIAICYIIQTNFTRVPV